MKRKRLNRDAWGFQYYPYYQMRIDHELFHGLACLIRFTDGEKNHWRMPMAGSVQVTGSGMTWLELIPDDARRVITVFYFPDGTREESRSRYPVPANPLYQPSLWYIPTLPVKACKEHEKKRLKARKNQRVSLLFLRGCDIILVLGDKAVFGRDFYVR